MKIIIHLERGEGERKIEDNEENIRPASEEIIRQIERILGGHQIRYTEIEVFGDE